MCNQSRTTDSGEAGQTYDALAATSPASAARLDELVAPRSAADVRVHFLDDHDDVPPTDPAATVTYMNPGLVDQLRGPHSFGTDGMSQFHRIHGGSVVPDPMPSAPAIEFTRWEEAPAAGTSFGDMFERAASERARGIGYAMDILPVDLESPGPDALRHDNHGHHPAIKDGLGYTLVHGRPFDISALRTFAESFDDRRREFEPGPAKGKTLDLPGGTVVPTDAHPIVVGHPSDDVAASGSTPSS